MLLHPKLSRAQEQEIAKLYQSIGIATEYYDKPNFSKTHEIVGDLKIGLYMVGTLAGTIVAPVAVGGMLITSGASILMAVCAGNVALSAYDAGLYVAEGNTVGSVMSLGILGLDMNAGYCLSQGLEVEKVRLKAGKYSAFGEMSEADGIRYRDWNYEKIHEISIDNPNSDSMTLGKYFDGTLESGSYVAKAEATGDTYFSLGTQWDDVRDAYGLSDKDMFDLFNTRALDDAVSQGKTIRFSQNPMEWRGTALGDEWSYLQNNYGYTRLKQIGDYWYAK